MPARPARLLRPRALLWSVCLLALAALAGCTGLPSTGDKGFVTEDGQVRTIAVGERDEPIALAGEDLDGESLDLEDLRGQVVVVNVWGSWCGPCLKEMPDLVEAAETLAADEVPVQFVGINVRDHDVAQAQGFERNFDVPYPSIHSPDGKALLPFSGTVPPSRIPSTVVLDDQGRVAAAVIGVLPSAITLVNLVEDVADEGDDG